jgi:hypothetical protein
MASPMTGSLVTEVSHQHSSRRGADATVHPSSARKVVGGIILVRCTVGPAPAGVVGVVLLEAYKRLPQSCTPDSSSSPDLFFTPSFQRLI